MRKKITAMALALTLLIPITSAFAKDNEKDKYKFDPPTVITSIQTTFKGMQTAIATNKADIATNKNNIAKNTYSIYDIMPMLDGFKNKIADLFNKVGDNAKAIAKNSSDIATLMDTVTGNTSRMR